MARRSDVPAGHAGEPEPSRMLLAADTEADARNMSA